MRFLYHTLLYLRQLVFYVYGSLVIVAFGTISPILYFLRVPASIRIRMPHFWSILWRIGIHYILWIRIEVKGKKNIPDRPCIFVCKHQSQLETFYLNYYLPRAVYVFKKELLSTPFLGWGLIYTGSIPIDRSQGVKSLKEVIKKGKEKLANGVNVIIFPEGSRSKPGDNPKFHKSGLMLANASNGDVVLVAHNTGSIKRKKRKIIRPKKISIIISEPINAKEYSLDELNEYCHKWMKEQMALIEKQAYEEA